jgi:D-alanine transaminase
MSRIVYVNGAYLPEEEAKISVFDRGFLFADGVYEVSSVARSTSSIWRHRRRPKRSRPSSGR